MTKPKPSELFESENSSLYKTYKKATENPIAQKILEGEAELRYLNIGCCGGDNCPVYNTINKYEDVKNHDDYLMKFFRTQQLELIQTILDELSDELCNDDGLKKVCNCHYLLKDFKVKLTEAINK